jgi:molybdate transport system permease protein
MASPSQQHRPHRRQPPLIGPRRWLLPLLGLPLLAVLVLPLASFLIKLPRTLLVHYLGESATAQAIALSLGTSTAAVVLIIAFGTPLAHILARRRFRGRTLLEVLIDLPTVLPPAVAGIALLMAFGRRGVFGPFLESLGVQIAFTPLAVVLAQTFVAAPYYIKSAMVGLAAVSEELHESAALDGASPSQTFRHVTLPLAWRGIIGGAALCWARALGEFGATIIFAGNYPGRTQTMPLAIYIGFEIDLNQALVLAAILLSISFGLLLLIRATLRPQ